MEWEFEVEGLSFVRLVVERGLDRFGGLGIGVLL